MLARLPHTLTLPLLLLVSALCPHGWQPARLLCPWDSPGNNTGVGCHALLQGIFLTQGSHPRLLHSRRFLTTEPFDRPYSFCTHSLKFKTRKILLLQMTRGTSAETTGENTPRCLHLRVVCHNAKEVLKLQGPAQRRRAEVWTSLDVSVNILQLSVFLGL